MSPPKTRIMNPVLTARATAPTSTCDAPGRAGALRVEDDAAGAFGGVVAPFGGFAGALEAGLDAIRASRSSRSRARARSGGRGPAGGGGGSGAGHRPPSPPGSRPAPGTPATARPSPAPPRRPAHRPRARP